MTSRPPKEAYTEDSWFEYEKKAVFGRAWTFAGTVHDFTEAGDFRVVTSGAASLAVVRDKDGDLNAVHNICRHRGAELLDGESGNCGGTMVCPYHRWTYGLDGTLRGVPNRQECFPDLDRSALGLHPSAIGTFKDLVFVNPDPQADFASWLGPLEGREWPHDLAASDVKEAVPLVYDMKCDWKVYVENALDGYHLAYLHENAELLNIDRKRIAIGGESAGGGLAAALSILARDRGEFDICHQHLTYPMLDNRTGNESAPGDPLVGEFVWTREHNQFGWKSYLGDAPAEAPQVPARLTDFSGLPSTWLFTVGLDLFRDENIEYAQQLMKAGVPTDLEIMAGACHGFQAIPGTVAGKRYRDAHIGALKRALSKK